MHKELPDEILLNLKLAKLSWPTTPTHLLSELSSLDTRLLRRGVKDVLYHRLNDPRINYRLINIMSAALATEQSGLGVGRKLSMTSKRSVGAS